MVPWDTALYLKHLMYPAIFNGNAETENGSSAVLSACDTIVIIQTAIPVTTICQDSQWKQNILKSIDSEQMCASAGR